MPTLQRIFGNLRYLIVHFFSISTNTKRRPRVAYSSTEVLALPLESNKQQETYADMTNCFDRNTKAGYCHTHRHLLNTLILTLNLKVAKFQLIKRKASINAFQYVLLPPPMSIRDTLGVSLRCKVINNI